MADDITYSGSGATVPTNTKQVTDEHATRGHMPVIKLAYSADGDATLITADANGLEVQLGAAIPAGSNNIGDVDVLTMPDVTVVGKAADGAAVSGNPVLIAGQDGTNAQSIKTDSNGELQVDVLTLPSVTINNGSGGSAVNVQDGGNSLTVDGTMTAVGDVAHDTTDSGNPQKIGGRASNALDTATMVGSGDRIDFVGDLDGVQLVRSNCPLANILSERVTDTGGSSTALSTFGATSSTRNYITTIIVYNDSTTNGFVDIRDGTGGSVLLTLPLPAKGGSVINLPTPLRQPTANTALAYDVSAALTTVYLSFIGFKSKA